MTTLDELRRLHEQATSPPWAEEDGAVVVPDADAARPIDRGLLVATMGRHDIGPAQRRANAALIAAAHNAIPALLALVDAAHRAAEWHDITEGDHEDPCPEIADTGGPCAWCGLRGALAALDG